MSAAAQVVASPQGLETNPLTGRMSKPAARLECPICGLSLSSESSANHHSVLHGLLQGSRIRALYLDVARAADRGWPLDAPYRRFVKEARKLGMWDDDGPRFPYLANSKQGAAWMNPRYRSRVTAAIRAAKARRHARLKQGEESK